MDGFRVRLADLQSAYTHTSELIKYGSDLCMVRRGAHRLEALGIFAVSLKLLSLGHFTGFFELTQM